MAKLGKYKNCKKIMARFGLSKKEQELACARYLTDDEWEPEELEKPKVKKTGFEIEKPETPEKKEQKKSRLERLKSLWKEFTPAGGKGAGLGEMEKRRPIKSVPLAFQLPIFQPWRAIKSEHRLQTKMEKIITAEKSFLTQEQLLKRSQYAVTIKKRDSDQYIHSMGELLELCESIEDLKEKIIIIKLQENE